MAVASPVPQVPRPEGQSEWTDIVSKQYLDKLLPAHERSILGGLELRPKNIRFATQNKGEKVYILLRRHWFTNLGWISNAAFFAILPLVVVFLLQIFRVQLPDLLSTKVWLILILSYYGLVVTFILRNLIDWFFNLFIVTNERIIDYNVNLTTTQLGAGEMALENIEEVKQNSVGIIASFLNFGDVLIKSAADRSVIKFEKVPRPTFVRDIISDLTKVVKSFNRNES